MARNTFGIGNLNAATPGLSKLAMALAGGDQAYQQGFDQAATGQSRIAQAIAAARASDAQTGFHNAQAREENLKADALARRPDLFDEQVANSAGVDIPTVQGYRSQVKTGQAPLVPMGPPTEDGSMGAGSLVIPDATKSKLVGAIQQYLPLLANGGDLNPEQLAKANTEYAQNGRLEGILGGTLDRNKVAGAEAAIAAKPLFNQNADGAVLDQYGGRLDTANPMAQASIGLRNSQASAARARVAGGGSGNGTGKAPVGYRYTSDPTTGDAVLEPIPGGPKDPANQHGKPIPPNVNAKIIEGQQGLSNIDAAIAALEADPGAVGWSNAIPGAQTVKQLWASPEDIGTRAQVANIGSLVLHDRSGAAVSASEFPRLAPFIPSASDSKATAVTKLRKMKTIAEQELGLYADTYGPESGYMPNPILQRRPGAQPPAKPPVPAGKNVNVDY